MQRNDVDKAQEVEILDKLIKDTYSRVDGWPIIDLVIAIYEIRNNKTLFKVLSGVWKTFRYSSIHCRFLCKLESRFGDLFL